MERESGLPCPPDDAPYETFRQWFVAYVFMIAIKSRKDKATASIWAANILLKDDDYLEKLPYLEEAFGRALTPEELTARHIVSIEDFL